MGADQARLGALQVGEARPPHQRAIAENPEVLGGVIDAHHPSITTKSPICRSYGQNGAAREDSTSERPYSAASTWVGRGEFRACPGARLMLQSEPARRRPLWPVFVPLALVVALSLLWTGLWFFAAGAAEQAIAGWREREAKVGRVYTCDRQTISGFPFRIEVRCADPVIELRRDDPPVALRAADLVVVSQVYQPTLLISEFTGPMTIAEPGQPPSYVANWTLGQSSVRGTPAAPERVSIVIDRPFLDRAAGATPANVLKADRVELHGRMAGGSAAGNPVIELALRLVAATAPEMHAFMARPVDAEITATLRGLSDFSPKPWPVRFREL